MTIRTLPRPEQGSRGRPIHRLLAGGRSRSNQEVPELGREVVGNAVWKQSLSRLGTDRLLVIGLKLFHREVGAVAPSKLGSSHELMVDDVPVRVAGVLDRALGA